MNEKVVLFRNNLCTWFDFHKRDLPWRHERSAYKTWLSEIILQQTRIQQGLPYFERFLAAYATVEQFAAADSDEIMRMWQGLGYYSRARNMHAAAKQVVSEFGGNFPQTLQEIKSLKGIGNYTAAAILSLAYGLPFAVLDGNVYRVLARVYAITLPINDPKAEKVYQQKAEELLDRNHPAVHNEAMMELGALICIPKNPLCHMCPVRNSCDAFHTGMTHQLPYKIATKAVKDRFLHYLFIFNSPAIILRKRESSDIWQGLFDFPLVETDNEQSTVSLSMYGLGTEETMLKPIAALKHKLTHQLLHIRFYEWQMPEGFQLPEGSGLLIVPISDIDRYGVPKPIESFLNSRLHLKGESDLFRT